MAYEALFQTIAAERGLDWHLLAQQAWRESRMNALAVGAAGDMGLMQILPATWNEWAPKLGVFDPFDPESNIRAAAAILAYLRDVLAGQSRPELCWTLTAYNWGIGNVLRLLKSGGTWEPGAAATPGLCQRHHPGGRGECAGGADGAGDAGVRITR